MLTNVFLTTFRILFYSSSLIYSICLFAKANVGTQEDPHNGTKQFPAHNPQLDSHHHPGPGAIASRPSCQFLRFHLQLMPPSCHLWIATPEILDWRFAGNHETISPHRQQRTTVPDAT